MTLLDLVLELRRRRVVLFPDGHRCGYRAPAGALEGIREVFLAHRNELRELVLRLHGPRVYRHALCVLEARVERAERELRTGIDESDPKHERLRTREELELIRRRLPQARAELERERELQAALEVLAAPRPSEALHAGVSA